MSAKVLNLTLTLTTHFKVAPFFTSSLLLPSLEQKCD